MNALIDICSSGKTTYSGDHCCCVTYRKRQSQQPDSAGCRTGIAEIQSSYNRLRQLFWHSVSIEAQRVHRMYANGSQHENALQHKH